MGEPTSTLAAEIDAVREAYAALNRGDVAGFVRLFDADVERIEEFSGFACRGLPAMTRHVAEARATWAEGGCQPQRFAVAPGERGGRVIAFVDVRVRLKNETQWREGRVGDVYTFRDGKVIEFRTFADVDQAVRWAGAPIPETGPIADGTTDLSLPT
jgi:ketosteroid isomerase-like protein